MQVIEESEDDWELCEKELKKAKIQQKKKMAVDKREIINQKQKCAQER